MLSEFQAHIARQFPQWQGQKTLLACSGGVDSMVLLDLCLRSGKRPAVAHCNFQLRDAASHDDAEWVRAWAIGKGMDCHVREFDTRAYAEQNKISIQMAARALRYKWFENLAAQFGYEVILMAHHADDALETFLHHSMRGTGLKGMLGIPEKNDKVLRPLLPFAKKMLVAYAKSQHILWREDASNATTDYLRNALRHEVIPHWKALTPNFDHGFAVTLQQLSHAQQALSIHLNDLKERIFQSESYGFKIATTDLKTLNPPEYYLFELFAPFGFVHTADLIRLLEAQSGKQLESSTYRLIKDRECWLLTEKHQPGQAIYMIPEDTTVIAKPIALRFETVSRLDIPSNAGIHVDKCLLKFPLSLRRWRQSDYFYPTGMRGKKLLSKYFKDEKYSLIEKENQWLLCSGEAIVWVIGRRADRRFTATDATKELLLISCGL